VTEGSYVGRVLARKGLLLGGQKAVWSSRFSTLEQAFAWGRVLASNQQARRPQVSVAPSELPPEIDREGEVIR